MKRLGLASHVSRWHVAKPSSALRFACVLAISACGGEEPVEESAPEYSEGAYATAPGAGEGTDLRFTEVARESGLDFVHNESREVSGDFVLSNAFGFGGHNACLAIRAWAAR